MQEEFRDHSRRGGRERPGRSVAAAVVHEFDLGYVVWAEPPADQSPAVGAGRGSIDRDTGESSVWPLLPVDLVIKQYQRTPSRARPRQQWTWDPAEQARWDLRHPATPPTSPVFGFQVA